ncbi:MAG: MotA/TolQ/ExbB proton channel family protein [Deltaproteobacteria bacterium]|nr:MotA/TolQ/ExbB proton channel family protein [Deltaproteobacteria bacterium]
MNSKNILIGAGALVVLGVALVAGRDLLMFFNPAGLALVVGGTLVAVFLAFPKETLQEVWNQLRSLGQPRVMSTEQLVELFSNLVKKRRLEGPRAMEELAAATGNQFLLLGVALVADERPPEVIRERLEQELDFFLSRRESERAALSFMGRLAPAFGLAGTMVGLIRMLHTLKDPGSVAEGMSVALLTTFYGLMLANLVVLPAERKLKEHNRAEAVEMTLITEGVLGLSHEENAAALSARLRSFRFAHTETAAPAANRSAGPAWLKNLRPLTPAATRSTGDDV